MHHKYAYGLLVFYDKDLATREYIKQPKSPRHIYKLDNGGGHACAVVRFLMDTP
jgi:hypothetical protein